MWSISLRGPVTRASRIYDELLFDEDLLMLNLLSRLPRRQGTDQTIETLRRFFQPPKARQQTCEASAKRIGEPDDAISRLRNQAA